MKVLVVLSAFAALCAGVPIPEDIPPRDNSHYVEGVSRYVWMADGEGELHLVDLEDKEDALEFTDARNGADNQYWLFTRSNRNNRQVLRHNDNNSVRNSNYRGNRGLVVIVHGWNSDGNSRVNVVVRDAFLHVLDVNVIVVDWHRLANRGYYTASNGVRGVGDHLGDFLDWLIRQHGGNWNNVHLVGFSLGAHVVGNAGRRVGGRPSRVTGLDPAGPRFGGNSNRLQRNAGRYVEAIHTDGRALGIMDPSGDTDFYPNGGRHPQPGCSGGITQTSCSHSRAPELFAASVRYNRFDGRRCNDLRQAENVNCSGGSLRMGNREFNKSGSAGLYALRTGANWPF
ncbi:hypothetical protein ABMA27_006928 [Loxostege sticticalis]|uniref:Lipase domain-containing protein n=1 Tax=Loxostege sticticalis TaxID=481309 RepID=A0ABR3IL01_LOXSC